MLRVYHNMFIQLRGDPRFLRLYADTFLSSYATPGDGNVVSRYNPEPMNCINIEDLVQEDSSDSDDSEDGVRAPSADAYDSNGTGCQQKRKAGRVPPLCYRQMLIIVSLVGIIIAASAAIGYAVLNSNGGEKAYSAPESDDSGGQTLLETAERINVVCSEYRLNNDRRDCQEMCYTKLCCFEEGDYSCVEDDREECAVYAGCEALVEGIVFDGAEEDEE